MACGVALKTDWYQTEADVVVTVLMKNLKDENVDVKFTETTLHVTVSLPDEAELGKDFHLAHRVLPEQCSYKIMSTKIEIKLRKQEGIRWGKLEGNPDQQVPKAISAGANIPSGNKPPTYPTSKGTDWSALEKQIKEQEAKEKPEGEEALNKLFQDIYGKGGDDVKKAMNKSFMESGGTVLSTNWNEISAKKVDINPPSGMEWKKWDS